MHKKGWKLIETYDYKNPYITEIVAWDDEEGNIGGDTIAEIIFPEKNDKEIEINFLDKEAKNNAYSHSIINKLVKEKESILEAVRNSNGKDSEGYYFQVEVEPTNLEQIKEITEALKNKEDGYKIELGSKEDKIIIFKVMNREKFGNELDERPEQFASILLKPNVYQEFRKNPILDKITTWNQIK